eukprot:tig00020902_g15054.t1
MARERAAKRARVATGEPAPAPAPVQVPDTAGASSSGMASAGHDQAARTFAPSTSAGVAAVLAAGGSPFDALPDDLVTRIIAEASACFEFFQEYASIPMKSHSPRVTCTFQNLSELAQLSHVSRRFRSLAQQPSLWQSVLIGSASDDVISTLVDHQKSKHGEALRSLYMSSGVGELSSDSVMKLCKSFGMQLTALGFILEESVLPGILPGIRHFSHLQELSITSESGESRSMQQNSQIVAGPIVQGSVQALASLPLQALTLEEMPITLETLRALAPLAPTLTRLACGVFVEEATLAPVCSSVAAFQRLEQLKLECFDATGTSINPTASEADLEPLSSLASLKACCVEVIAEHIGFLEGMRQLEYVLLIIQNVADTTPLLRLPGLRRAFIGLPEYNESTSRRLAATASKLPTLEHLELCLPSGTFLAFAEQPMHGWTGLKSLHLFHSARAEVDGVVPGAFFSVGLRLLPPAPPPPPPPPPRLRRLASDVPSLETLTVEARLPLDSAAGFLSVTSLQRLRRLELAKDAAAARPWTTRRARRFD